MESVTIKDIAKKCNVAVSTVSRALNNHPDINEQTRQKILKAIQELHYIPNNSAQNLKKTVSKTIGIVVKGADNPLFAKMRSILAENIAQYDYDYYFEYISIQEDEIRTALRLIKEKRLKGLIFLGGNYDRKLEDLQQLTVPFVMSTVNIQEEVPRAAFSSVFTDSYKESRRMVEYLCRKGFQKIVIFAGSKNDASVGNLRLKGYLDELAANQIPPDENRMASPCPTLSTCAVMLARPLAAIGSATTRHRVEAANASDISVVLVRLFFIRNSTAIIAYT